VIAQRAIRSIKVGYGMPIKSDHKPEPRCREPQPQLPWMHTRKEVVRRMC